MDETTGTGEVIISRPPAIPVSSGPHWSDEDMKFHSEEATKFMKLCDQMNEQSRIIVEDLQEETPGMDWIAGGFVCGSYYALVGSAGLIYCYRSETREALIEAFDKGQLISEENIATSGELGIRINPEGSKADSLFSVASGFAQRDNNFRKPVQESGTFQQMKESIRKAARDYVKFREEMQKSPIGSKRETDYRRPKCVSKGRYIGLMEAAYHLLSKEEFSVLSSMYYDTIAEEEEKIRIQERSA